MEYVEIGASKAEPSVVFCRGLHPSDTQFTVALIEEDFRNHLNGGPTGEDKSGCGSSIGVSKRHLDSLLGKGRGQ